MNSLRAMLPRLFLVAGLALQCPNGLAAGITGLDVQYVNDSNPARAEFSRDIESAASIRAAVTGILWSNSLVASETKSSGLAFTFSADYEHNLDIELLGESRYRLGFGYFREAKRVAGAPFLRAGFGVSRLDSESVIRDSTLLDASLSLNVQPVPFFDATVGASFEQRDAETLVFDTRKATLFVTGNFSPVPRFVLRTGVRYIFGDEVSTSTPTTQIIDVAEVIEADDAFGGVSERRFAYLVDASTLILEAGLGYELSPSWQTNLLYRVISTEADGSRGYDRTRIEFTLSLNL